MKVFGFQFSVWCIAFATVVQAQVRISELPVATNVAGAEFAIVQDGQTRRIDEGLVRSVDATNVSGLGPYATATNLLSVDIADWTNAVAAVVAGVAVMQSNGVALVTNYIISPEYRFSPGGVETKIREAPLGDGGGIEIVWQGTVGAKIGASAANGGLLMNKQNMALRFGPANTNGAGITRTNLGLGWSGLTNTDAAGFREDLRLGPYATATNITHTNISDWTNALLNATVGMAFDAGYAGSAASAEGAEFLKGDDDAPVLSKRSGTWMGDLAGLNAALGTPDPGTAPVGAVLTVVPGGTSGFVPVNRPIFQVVTNDVTKVYWPSASAWSPTNIATPFAPPMPVVAAATYLVRYHIGISVDSTNLLSTYSVAFVFPEAPGFGGSYNAGVGAGMSGAVGSTTASDNGTHAWISPPMGVSQPTHTNRNISGSFTFTAKTNGLCVPTFAPAATNSSEAYVIRAGSWVQMQQISP